MIQITRRLEFDAGHRVLGHEGRCKHIHGHRYAAEITIQGPGLDSLGRVIDFGVVKSLLGHWIDSHWDHNLLLNSEDPLWDEPFFRNERRPYLFEGCNPTAENMARELWQVAIDLLASNLQVVRVRIWETPSCYADFVPDPPGIPG